MGSDWTDDKPVYPTPLGLAIGRAALAREAADAAGASSEAAFARAGEAVMAARLAREDADRALGDSKLALVGSARAVELAWRANVIALANIGCLVLVIILVVVLS